MDANNLNDLSVRERMLIEQVRAHPGLGEKLHALMASARGEQLGEASADEAEERIVEQMRALGLEALQGLERAARASCG